MKKTEGKGKVVPEGRMRNKEEVSEMMDDSIRCFCENRVKKEEMVCCDACSGWFHLKCMGMKEGADVMKGKEFVFPFLCFLNYDENVGGDCGVEKGIGGSQK